MWRNQPLWRSGVQWCLAFPSPWQLTLGHLLLSSYLQLPSSECGSLTYEILLLWDQGDTSPLPLAHSLKAGFNPLPGVKGPLFPAYPGSTNGLFTPNMIIFIFFPLINKLFTFGHNEKQQVWKGRLKNLLAVFSKLCTISSPKWPPQQLRRSRQGFLIFIYTLKSTYILYI